MSRTLAVPPSVSAIAPQAKPPLTLRGGPLKRASKRRVSVVVLMSLANRRCGLRLIARIGQSRWPDRAMPTAEDAASEGGLARRRSISDSIRSLARSP